jgi:hypothetical protein
MQLKSNTASCSLPIFPDFIPFSTLDRDTYESYISEYEPYSDYGYTSLYAWSRDKEHYISSLHGNLVLALQDYKSEQKVISFLGTNNVDTTASALLDFVSKRDEFADELVLIPEVTAQLLSDSSLTVAEDIDNHDYILSTKHFVNLTGPGFAHTRRKISQFQRSYGAESQLMDIDLRDCESQAAIHKLAYEWAFMGTEGTISAHEEIAAIKRLLKDIDTLNYKNNIHCFGLYIRGKLEGFCIYEIQKDFAVVHFIKANINSCGAADYMMVSTMRNILLVHNVTKVNHEQDLGIAGLRAAKKRYCPTAHLKKYTISEVAVCK